MRGKIGTHWDKCKPNAVIFNRTISEVSREGSPANEGELRAKENALLQDKLKRRLLRILDVVLNSAWLKGKSKLCPSFSLQ